MTTQLVLVEEPHDWRLDDRTREVGRRGVRDARVALGRGAVAQRGSAAPAPAAASPATPPRPRAA